MSEANEVESKQAETFPIRFGVVESMRQKPETKTKGDDMTDAELEARLERLSEEDLQELLGDPLKSQLRRHSWLQLYGRMAREILDLRQQLKEEREACAKIAEHENTNIGARIAQQIRLRQRKETNG